MICRGLARQAGFARGRRCRHSPSLHSPFAALPRTRPRHARKHQARVLRDVCGAPHLHADPGRPSRRAARQAREREHRRDGGADPRRCTRLPDRRGARRAGRHLPCHQELPGAHAQPADRVEQRRGLRYGRRQGLHGGRRAGGQPVGGQPPLGRRARARDAVDAVEAHHRDRPRHAPRGRHEPQHLHWQRSAGQDHRHRRARQRGEPRGGALPRPVRHAGAGLRPLPLRRGGRAARRQEGRARYVDGRGRLRVGQLPAHRGDPRHDRGEAVRAHEADGVLHQHRARLHPRREGAGGAAESQEDRRRRARRVGQGAPAHRSSPAEVRQRAGEPAHGRRHQGGARQHGQDRRRAAARGPRRQAPPRLINPQAWPLYARRFEQILGSRPIAPPRSI